MIDKAGIRIEFGNPISCERIENINSNMSQSHYHTFYELYFLEKGQRKHIMGNEMYQMSENEFMIFSPYTMHRSYSEENVPFRRIVLYFREDSINAPELQELMKKSSGLYQPTAKVANLVHSYLSKLLKEQENKELLHDATMNSLLNSLLITIMKSVTVSSKPEPKNRILKIIDFIEQNYTEDINLDEIANEFFMSKFYLCHEFKKYTNRTIVQYINSLRIMHAQRVIMETTRSFSDIASITGFSSSTQFYRVFKDIAGESPSEFRKRNCHKSQTTTKPI